MTLKELIDDVINHGGSMDSKIAINDNYFGGISHYLEKDQIVYYKEGEVILIDPLR